MQPCGLRKWARPRGLQSFGLKTKRVAECVRRTLAKRALKNIRAALRAAKMGTSSGLRSFGLKIRQVAECVRRTLAERALKNNHTALRTAKMSTSSGTTVVWPQDQTSCGLRPQRVSRKRHAPEPIDELGARQATFVGVTIISLVAEDDMINQLDVK